MPRPWQPLRRTRPLSRRAQWQCHRTRGWRILAPIGAADWSYDRARHLLERAGFGGTPEEVARLARMTPEQAVLSLVDYQSIPNDHSRRSSVPASGTRRSQFPPEPAGGHQAGGQTGKAMGVAVKPCGRAPAAAGGRPLLLLAARHAPGDPPAGQLVGRPHGRDQAPARREDGAVLARPFRDRRGEGPRLPQDASSSSRCSTAAPPAISASC